MDLSETPIESVRELHQQAEACLSGTVQLAVAADQRATTMAGIFGAGAIALLAAVATLLSATTLHIPLMGGTCAMAVLLFSAAVMSAMAAAPTDFHVGGYEPKKLFRSAGDVTWMLRYVVDDLQKRIDFNREVLVSSARRLRISMVLALAAVPFGALVFIFLRAGRYPF